MKSQLGSEDYRDPDHYDYHYDREERLSHLSPEARAQISGRSSTGIFRKNRTLSIILIDIVVIALVWFVFLPLIRTGPSGRLEGYSFVLHSFSYGGRALISLKAVKDDQKAGLPPSYSAAFGLSSSNRSVEMQGGLPMKVHQTTTLRTSLPLSGKTNAVVCTVVLGGKKLKLKARLQPES